MGVERTSPTVREAGKYAQSRANALRARMLGMLGIVALILVSSWLLLGGREWLLVLIELGAIALMVVADRVFSPQFDHWLQGARGEQKVGAVLDRLSQDGWRALHDISLGRGNIDHILVGPAGIFAIETKSRRTPIRVEHIHGDMLKQAYAEKKLLERITGYKVQALLVFSEAWLIGSLPAERHGVLILPARMLDGYIRQRPLVVTPSRAEEVHGRLAAAFESLSESRPRFVRRPWPGSSPA